MAGLRLPSGGHFQNSSNMSDRGRDIGANGLRAIYVNLVVAVSCTAVYRIA
jgi:hypothetical protein